MRQTDIARIETELGVTLDEDYRAFLLRPRTSADPDVVSLQDDSSAIIEATSEYRKGMAELPPWPERYVYIGDEADACPYVLDCETQRVLRLDKGNLEREPLESHAAFATFLAQKTVEPVEKRSRDVHLSGIFVYAPVAAALLTIFVVAPLIAMGISALFGLEP